MANVPPARPWSLWVYTIVLAIVTFSEIRLVHYMATVDDSGHGPMLYQTHLSTLCLRFAPTVILLGLTPVLWGLKRWAWGISIAVAGQAAVVWTYAGIMGTPWILYPILTWIIILLLLACRMEGAFKPRETAEESP